jgi:leucyl aminopeptidase
MLVLVKEKKELAYESDALILPVFEDEGIDPYKSVDQAVEGLMRKVWKSEEFTGRRDEITLIHTFGKIKSERIMLVGLGRKSDSDNELIRRAGGRIASFVKTRPFERILISTRTLVKAGLSPIAMLEGVLLGSYEFRRYRKEQTTDRQTLKEIFLLHDEDLIDEVRWSRIICDATCFARDLINTPAIDMTPSDLAMIASSIKGVSTRVIEKKQAKKMGLNAFLAVSKGSSEPPKFIVMNYKKGGSPHIVLIGKSITFDSGGVSLKRAEGLHKMKYDMSGGAAVLGVMKAVSELGLNLNITGILPATENMPGGGAIKPGDIVKTIDGKSIEIVSTDAEGRLTIADAMGYAKQLKPSLMIDIATLTGAASIAFGNETIIMFGNDESLIEKIKDASDRSGERVWQMPIYDEYREYLKSDVADIKNSSGRKGALATSGYFLREFAGDIPWVHLDIAGTAWAEKGSHYNPPGGTGTGVRLLMYFLKEFSLS